MSDAPEKILVRGVNWLGDAIMSTPALLRLREALPGAHIAIVTPAKLADLWKSHPAINEVISFTKADGVGKLSKQLRSSAFQKALILPNSFRSAFESWLAGIPSRIGFGGNGRNFLLTKVVPRRRDEIEMRKRSAAEVKALVAEAPDKPRDRFPLSGHQIHNYLHLATVLGANPSPLPPRIAVTESEINQLRQAHSISGSFPVIALNPGAEYGPAKRWPADRFIEVASRVEAYQQSSWLITGGPADAELALQIAAGIQNRSSAARIHNLTGKTTLRELCVALAMCDAVLTNDTGPMHVAAALGRRVIVPFGSTSPELTGPGLPGDDYHRLILGQAPCAPCFLRECPIDFRCMLSIDPDAVARELLSSLRPKENRAP